MSEVSRQVVAVRLYASQEDALRLFFEDKVGGTMRWTSDPREPVVIQVEIVGETRPIYVSRPTERITAYTGPCGEDDCDGWHVVGHLPREWDHTPDGWEPMLFDIRVNGASVERPALDKLLAACVPAERVQQIRDVVARIDERTGYVS